MWNELFAAAAQAHQQRTGCLVQDRGGYLVLAFSCAPPATLTELTALQADMAVWRGIPVHRAWFEAAESQANKINGLEGRPVRVCGYGFGGAVAQIAALWLALETSCDVEGVATFGQPMPGRTPFKEIYEAELGACTRRYVHGYDPVPYLPPWFSLLHFTDFHAGPARVLGRQAGPQPLIWTEGMVTDLGRVEDGGPAAHPGIADHALDRYGAALT